MAGTRLTLDVLRIEEPCEASWRAMRGDARVRFCDRCGKHVHNLHTLSDREVSDLLAAASGGAGGAMPCVRVVAEGDGTVITRDTPWRRRATAAARRWTAWAAALLLAHPLIGCTLPGSRASHIAGAPKARDSADTLRRVAPRPVAGTIAVPRIQPENDATSPE